MASRVQRVVIAAVLLAGCSSSHGPVDAGPPDAGSPDAGWAEDPDAGCVGLDEASCEARAFCGRIYARDITGALPDGGVCWSELYARDVEFIACIGGAVSPAETSAIEPGSGRCLWFVELSEITAPLTECRDVYPPCPCPDAGTPIRCP